MSELIPADKPTEAAPTGVDMLKMIAPDPAKFWSAAGPYLEKMAASLIAAIERSNRHTGIVTGVLLGMIISTLTGLAAYCLFLGRVDTAEKVIIAMVSFLGGAAMFSGPPKK